MSTIIIPGSGLYLPAHAPQMNIGFSGSAWPASSGRTYDAAGEGIHGFGSVQWADGDTSAKTLSSAGGEIIVYFTTATFSNAGTTARIGIQDLGGGTNPLRGDGTFDVYDDLVGNTDSIATGWKTIAMSVGTKSITAGDDIVIAIMLQSRAGADQLRPHAIFGDSGFQRPGISENLGSWSAGVFGPLQAYFKADDGVYGWLSNSFSGSSPTVITYTNSTNPDEWGLRFKLPWACQIDGLYFGLLINSDTSDFRVRLYADPLGTPTALHTYTGLASQYFAGTSSNFRGSVITVPPIDLDRDTDYMVAVKAEGAGNIATSRNEWVSTDWRSSIFGIAEMASGSRNNDTGAFGTTSSNSAMYLGVRVRKIYGAGVPNSGFNLGI